jgi:hypothetical protein
MRHELIGKAKATITLVKSHNIGAGAKETRKGVRVVVKLKRPNTVLNDFDKTLRPVYYEKNGQGAKEQKQLEGIDPITDLPQLTALGAKLGSIAWPDEQTGSTLIVYRGINDGDAYKLKDGTAHSFKLVPNDGGTVDEDFTFDTANVTTEVGGELLFMVGDEIDIELLAPEIVQDELPIEKPKKNAKQTPVQALAAQLGQDGEAATTH